MFDVSNLGDDSLRCDKLYRQVVDAALSGSGYILGADMGPREGVVAVTYTFHYNIIISPLKGWVRLVNMDNTLIKLLQLLDIKTSVASYSSRTMSINAYINVN